MQSYAKDSKCRHGQIARYFGDRWPNLPCGSCDVCAGLGAKKGRSATVAYTSPAAAAAKPVEAGEAPLAALRVVYDLAQGYRPFALGKSGLMRALRGTPDAPIKPERTEHFGALAALKKADVERLIEALIEAGYLRRDEDDEYRRLYLTADGSRAAHDGDVDFEWRMTPAVPEKPAKRGPLTSDDLPDEVDPALFETLKAWRREVAQGDNVPPYVVFADKVLLALAAHKPTNEFDLQTIPGIGPAKAAKYGEVVLEMVRKHAGGG
jgi:ATP-dependent DNA helicase RecQ